MYQTLLNQYISSDPLAEDRLTQALHSVLGPMGPLLHSGVSVAPHPKHFVTFLSPFIPKPDPLLGSYAAGRLFGLGAGMDGCPWPCSGLWVAFGPDKTDRPSEARLSSWSYR
jgi:hypothetical protein